jgi:hypothetical protein
MSKKYIESPLTAGWSRRDSIVILAQGKNEKMGKNGDEKMGTDLFSSLIH